MKIVLTTRRKPNLVSWLIKKYMGTEYSHCALVFREYGIDLVFECTAIFGVRIVTLEKFMEINRVIEEIPVQNHLNGTSAVQFCYSQLGDAYNFVSLLGMAFNKPKWGKDGDNSFQCSEMIARAFGINDENLDGLDVKELKAVIKDYI